MCNTDVKLLRKDIYIAWFEVVSMKINPSLYNYLT